MNKSEQLYCKLIGKKIREKRIQSLQKTLRQFSLECEIPPATLSRIENGTREPNFIVLKKISEGFGMTYPDFIKEIETVLPEKFSIYEE